MKIADVEDVQPISLVREKIDGVGVVFLGELLTRLTGFSAPVKVQNAMLQAWCTYWDATYYGAPAETFDLRAGARKARAEGLRLVVAENLS